MAQVYGKTATFMPKPIFGDNGSGMHTHQSIWKDGKPMFAGNKYADLSDMALNYIGGILKHAKALNAYTNPLTNSYKRLVPGYEAPVLLAYSSRNRSASCRIPLGSGPKAKRVEVRFPDPGANPYLAFAAMLMAGLDGIENKINPGDPIDKNLYDLPPEELEKVPTVCGSLREACEELDKDRAFLKKGSVFTDDAIELLSRASDGRGRAIGDDAAPNRVRHVLQRLAAGRRDDDTEERWGGRLVTAAPLYARPFEPRGSSRVPPWMRQHQSPPPGSPRTPCSDQGRASAK